MTVAELADALLGEMDLSCGNNRCMCWQKRERFECIVGVSPEEFANKILDRIERTKKPTERAQPAK